MIDPPKKIYLKHIDEKGLGVFAKDFIKSAEIIEICPIHLLGAYHVNEDKDTFYNYTFAYPFKAKPEERQFAICWGYGSLYNHNGSNSNADTYDNPNEQTISFVAIKDIQKDEEICIDYGSGWVADRKNLNIIYNIK